MLPTSIEIWHALENHRHAVCQSKFEKHVHKQDLECDFHFFNSHQTYLANKTYRSILTFKEAVIIDEPYNILLDYQPISYRSRGPPAFY
jgi:hypothetical protein